MGILSLPSKTITVDLVISHRANDPKYCWLYDILPHEFACHLKLKEDGNFSIETIEKKMKMWLWDGRIIQARRQAPRS